MPASPIPPTDRADIDAAWQTIAAYLADRGFVAKEAEDAAFWLQVDALQARDPVFSKLLAALAMTVVRSTPSGRTLLADGQRRTLRPIAARDTYYLCQPEHGLHFYGNFEGALEFIEMIQAMGGCVTSVQDDDQRGWMTVVFRGSEGCAQRVEAILAAEGHGNVSVTTEKEMPDDSPPA